MDMNEGKGLEKNSDNLVVRLSEKRNELVKLYLAAAEKYEQSSQDYHKAVESGKAISLEDYDENGLRTATEAEQVMVSEGKETISWRQGKDTCSFRGPKNQYSDWPIFLRLEFENYSFDSEGITCRAIDGWPTGPKRGVYKPDAPYKEGYYFGGVGTFQWHTWGGVGNIVKEPEGTSINHKAIKNLVEAIAQKEGVEPGHVKVKELIAYKHRGDQDLGLQYEIAEIKSFDPVYEQRDVTKQISFTRDTELAAAQTLEKYKLMKKASKEVERAKSELINIDTEIQDAGFVYTGAFDIETSPSEIIEDVNLAGEYTSEDPVEI